MPLIDTSPGGFFTLANTAFYLFVAVEVAMLLSGSMVAVALMLALMVVLSVLLIRFMNQLLGSDEPESIRPPVRRVSEPDVTPVAVSAPASAPARHAPAPRVTAPVA